MESVYIETSVVSYLVARPSRDTLTALRQQLTKDWWAYQRAQFACVISQEVLIEASKGQPQMAADRMATLRDLPLVAGGRESVELAADLMLCGLFPVNARTDANHLAIATCARADYLLTWNYRHLANAQVLNRLENFLGGRGLRLPRVCTPEELV